MLRSCSSIFCLETLCHREREVENIGSAERTAFFWLSGCERYVVMMENSVFDVKLLE